MCEPSTLMAGRAAVGGLEVVVHTAPAAVAPEPAAAAAAAVTAAIASAVATAVPSAARKATRSEMFFFYLIYLPFKNTYKNIIDSKLNH